MKLSLPIRYFSIITICFLSLNSQAQCTWETQLFDGYEYQTVVPDLIPGATIHNTPKSYAVYSGTYSLYMNMTNCNGGVGTCIGDTVYVRTMNVCPSLPVQLSAYLTTSFTGGPQSNVHLTVIDGNGVVLDEQDSVLAPYQPAWIQYTTGSITPTASTIKFILVTNVNGGNGNDLSLDEFKLERCLVQNSSATSQFICSNGTPTDLFNNLPITTTDTLGTWAGPSALSGGHLGTFTPFVNANGTYVYHSTPYGTGTGCPVVDDSVTVTLVLPPDPDLGVDTAVCVGDIIVLNPGTNPSFTYLWNDGSTNPILTVTSSVPGIQTYTVSVTDQNGCMNTDTVQVDYLICSGIGSLSDQSVSIGPNPANNQVAVSSTTMPSMIRVLNAVGQLVHIDTTPKIETSIDVTKLEDGFYFVEIWFGDRFIQKKLMVSGR